MRDDLHETLTGSKELKEQAKEKTKELEVKLNDKLNERDKEFHASLLFEVAIMTMRQLAHQTTMLNKI